MTTKLDEGLYVTTQPLPGAEQVVGAGQLVWLATPAPGRQVLRLPARQERNRWTFHERGYVIRSHDYMKTLKHRPMEGFYINTMPFPVTAEWAIPEGCLVALSYSQRGEPILYVARLNAPHIHVPSVGYRFPEGVLAHLKAAGFAFAPPPMDARPLH
jgi:hypothetical protein